MPNIIRTKFDQLALEISVIMPHRVNWPKNYYNYQWH